MMNLMKTSKSSLALIIGISLLWACSVAQDSKEKHIKNIKQLTFRGENAEAYFSHDGKNLIFQPTRDNYLCDQIFTMSSKGKKLKLVSTGKGRCTCSFFSPD